MSDQLEKIIESSEYIRSKFPKNYRPEVALITETDFEIPEDFKFGGDISIAKIPNFTFINTNKKNQGKILFAKTNKLDVLILHGRDHYYDGISMRDIGQTIYVLKYLGIKKIISVDETGHLNPRFKCGELALIYDHINLMGDNPLIGKNENELGIRFPDMSNAYDKELFQKVYETMQEKKYRINDSVYMGLTGPESETDAEARFYREAGADVAGYSIVPENITSVHCGIKFIAVGLITRELVADKMMEDVRSEKQKNTDQMDSLSKAQKKLSKILGEIVKRISG